MFNVAADSLESYLAHDPARRADLELLDALIRKAAPALTPYFHAGTPEEQPGMQFRMMGYGPFEYAARAGKKVLWPVIGVALQKNYISVYFAVTLKGQPVTDAYVGRLNETRAGRGNVSFVRVGQLDRVVMADLVELTQRLYLHDPASLAHFDRVG